MGAPTPTRALAEHEVTANIEHFRRPGPRGFPVRNVTLSGLPLSWELRDVVDTALALGIERVVAHVEPGRRVAAPGVERVVVVRTEPEARTVEDEPTAVSIPLEGPVLAELPAILPSLRSVPTVTLVWPYPGGPRPAPVEDVREALLACRAMLRTLPWGIKGLPYCTLRGLEPELSLEGRIWPTSNRYYVDADHQRERALLLRPDLLQLAKMDSCRFCKVDQRCDGAASEWLQAGLTGGLSPVEDSRTP